MKNVMKVFVVVCLASLVSACGEKKCNDESVLKAVTSLLEQNCKGCYSNPNTIRKLDVNDKTGAIMCELNVDVHIHGFNGVDSFKYTVQETEDSEELVTVYKK